MADLLTPPLSGYAAAQRQVHRSADFFVEQDVLRVLRNAVVAADAELAETTRAFVRVEQLVQQCFPARGRRVYDFAAFKRQPHAVYFAPM